MPALADRLAAALSADAPARQGRRTSSGWNSSRCRCSRSLAKIAALRQRLAGTPVTATEPVFGYMFAALGMQVRDMPFQMAVMNNTEPGASDVAAFENDLQQHRVKLLVYNSQASDPIAARMMRLAKASHIPVVGATETEPPGKTYQAWMMSELDAVDARPAPVTSHERHRIARRTPGAGRPRHPGQRQPGHRRLRVRRRARPEWRRQDDADARHPGPGAASTAAASASWAAPPCAAIPPSATCRRCAARSARCG